MSTHAVLNLLPLLPFLLSAACADSNMMMKIPTRKFKSGSSVESMYLAAAPTCVYNIHVKTGNEWGAGTDSTISMQLTGGSKSSESDERHQVSFDLPDYDDKFEAGNDDSFQINNKCVTNICRMILYTDDKGWFADWFVESVSVSLTQGAPAEHHHWILHQWLPVSGGPLSVVKDEC